MDGSASEGDRMLQQEELERSADKDREQVGIARNYKVIHSKP